ncbi:MAG: hypothetical protein COV76_03015, partial [Candidatus Omnitrophica bacterium CG11_big_fil_rev_8_21_14_0_20_64_10]
MKLPLKPSYIAATVLALGAVAWIFSGNLEQAKRHYGFTSAATADPADTPAAAKPAAGPAEVGRPEKAPAMVRVRRMEAAERVREIAVTGRTDVILDAE